MSRWPDLIAVAALTFAAPALAGPLGLGRPALPEEVAAWDVAVLPDGRGLPPGSGDVETGEAVFAEKCAACHGDFAEGLDNWPPLAGGEGSLRNRRPVKTVGSYWPHLSTVWDYVHRSMPFGAAQTVTADETYAITAYLLYSNGLVDDDFTLSNENFAGIALPNADGFHPDDREETELPRFSRAPCMTDCRPAPEVTMRAVDLNVTPKDEDGRPAGTLPDWRAAAVEAAPPAEPAADAPDPALLAAGEQVFRKCRSCHRVGEGARNGVGPVLSGVVGRRAGTHDGFNYSPAMAEAGEGGLVWTPQALHDYLLDPRKAVPRTKMAFAGLKKPEDREAVIAYLRSFEP